MEIKRKTLFLVLTLNINIACISVFLLVIIMKEKKNCFYDD